MLSVSVSFKEKKPNFLKKVMERAIGFTETGVAAGFPRGKLNTPHYKSDNPGEVGPSIIDVAIKNNYGLGVPQRDFMTPSAKKWMKFVNESLDQVKEGINTGKIDPEKFLSAMGQKGSDIISKEIIDLDTPPNSPYTIAKKGSSNPLVDTGDMARSTTWELRKAERKE